MKSWNVVYFVNCIILPDLKWSVRLFQDNHDVLFESICGLKQLYFNEKWSTKKDLKIMDTFPSSFEAVVKVQIYKYKFQSKSFKIYSKSLFR